MGYIKKLKNNELVGGTDKHTIYPVTSTKAVFEEITNGDESSFKSQEYLNNHIYGGEGGRINQESITNYNIAKDTLSEDRLDTALKTKIQEGYDTSWKFKGEYDKWATYDAHDVVYDSATNSSYISLQADNQWHPVNPDDEAYVEGWWQVIMDGKVSTDANNALVEYIENDLTQHVTNAITDANGAIQGMIDSAQYQLDTKITEAQDQLDAATNDANDAAEEARDAANTVETLTSQQVADAQIGYFECIDTAASGAADNETKITTSDAIGGSHYVKTVGSHVKVKMAKANTHAAPTYLQFGSNNATRDQVYYNGAAVDASNTWDADEVISVYYDGSVYQASNAQGGGGKAEKIKYENSQSGLASDNVQDALDEMDDNFHLGSGVNERINLSEYTTLQTYPNVGGGNKWLTNNNTYRYTGKFIPITAGQQYKIVAQESIYCQYALLKDEAYTNHNQGTPVQYATGCNRTDVAAGTSVIISAPTDAAYLYVAIYVGIDITPAAVFEYPNISIKEYIQDMDEEPTEGSSNLVSSGGVHEVIQDLNDDIESINSAVLDATYAVDSTTTLNLTCNHSSNSATYKQYYKFTIGKKYRITLSVESAASEIIQLVDLPRTGYLPWIGVMNLPTGALTITYIYTPSSVNGYLQAYTETNASNGKAVTAVIEQLSTLQDVNDGLVSIKSDINTNSADIDKIEDQVYYESGMTYKSYTGNRITPNRIGFKAIGSIVTGQSAAVFGDIAFVFGNGGRDAKAFNMKTRTVINNYIPINGAPSKTDGTAWHCNSSEFGTNYYAEGDNFPLLYIGGSQGDAIHELLVCRVMPDSTRVYHLDVVQVLTMPNSWGYANVAFDEERGKLILCAAEMVFRVCNPPAVVDGGGNPISTYTFTEEDVEQTITIDASSFNIAQDVAMHRGLLYLGNGHGTQDNAFFRVIDLYNGTLINDISIVGWFTDAAEGYSFYNEHMYIFGSSNVYKFWFM